MSCCIPFGPNNIPCKISLFNELFIWFKDSCFWHTMKPRVSLCSPQIFCWCSKSQRYCGYDSAGPVTLQTPAGSRSGKYWCRQTQISASVPQRRMKCFVCLLVFSCGWYFNLIKIFMLFRNFPLWGTLQVNTVDLERLGCELVWGARREIPKESINKWY